MKLSFFIISLQFLLASTCWAEDNNTQPELVVASANFSPYFVYDQSNTKGLFNDLLLAALSHLGYQRVLIKPFNNDGIKRRLLLGKADIALNWGGPVPEGFYTTNYHLKFVNRVIINKNSQLTAVQGLNDLKDLRIVSFINATKVFGPQYEALMTGENNYVEYADQAVTNRLFVAGKFDAKVGDWLMFLWSQRLSAQDLQKVGYYPLDILNYSGSQIVCATQKLCQLLDNEFDKMMLNGEVDAITEHWFNKIGMPSYPHQFFVPAAITP